MWGHSSPPGRRDGSPLGQRRSLRLAATPAQTADDSVYSEQELLDIESAVGPIPFAREDEGGHEETPSEDSRGSLQPARVVGGKYKRHASASEVDPFQGLVPAPREVDRVDQPVGYGSDGDQAIGAYASAEEQDDGSLIEAVYETQWHDPDGFDPDFDDIVQSINQGQSAVPREPVGQQATNQGDAIPVVPPQPDAHEEPQGPSAPADLLARLRELEEEMTRLRAQQLVTATRYPDVDAPKAMSRVANTAGDQGDSTVQISVENHQNGYGRR